MGVAAFLVPSLGESIFRKIERHAGMIARHRLASCLAIGILVLFIRGLLLPWWLVPKPAIYDEFSYLLQADTFAHGRVTNPTHPLWKFFESPYVLQHPTYASKYPPGQSLFLAFGQTLFGDPWVGVWLSCGLLAAALVWTLQGWLPPGWALLGGLFALPLSINSYWMNSYWGGSVAAIGGALLLGGYARVVRHKQTWYAPVMGISIFLLANTRPYEGLVFTIPVAIAFLFSRPRWPSLASITAIVAVGFAATGYYNRALTGSALQLPFTEYARQYARIPLFNFQPLKASNADVTPAMYDLHQNWEVSEWNKARTLGLLPMRVQDWRTTASTIFGSAMVAVLIVVFFPDLWRDRRIRLPFLCVLAALAGSLIEVRFYEHYAAPVTAALFIVAVQALRHLRQWRPSGRFLSRAIPILALGFAAATQIVVLVRPARHPAIATRDTMAAALRDVGRKHVILVRYTGHQSPHEEWVYNGADIDSQDVIWAHDLGAASNAPLLEYYKDRKIWLFQPDINFTKVDPYR